MRDLGKAIKLAMSVKNAKFSIIAGTVCFVVGAVMSMFAEDSSFIAGILMVYLPMFLAQFAVQQELANVAAASPLKKLLGLYAPGVISAVGAVLFIIVNIVASIVNLGREPHGVLEAYIFASVFLIYMGSVYKKYILSMVIMFLFIIIGGIGAYIIPDTTAVMQSAFAINVVGSIMVILAIVIQIALRAILFKLPYASYMYKSLERQMR